ncbi:MAG: hypothetical protein ABIU87_12325 [Ornithinibacter sp.]
MKRASVAVVVVLCAVFGIPPTAFAAGSYGAVVEKGVRGCTADDQTGIVICFEAPSVNPRSQGVFLQVWQAVSPYLQWRTTDTATLRVRSVSVGAGTPQEGRPVTTYAARADRVLPLLACNDDFRFQASNGNIRLVSIVSDCKAR